jgi:NAD(P)-dependent dehydrogenase (short-subunit alcohol dehydrogenase family)
VSAFDIAGKHAVVIGAGGIGRAVATGLMNHGAHVAVADLDGERAAQLAAELGAGLAGAPVGGPAGERGGDAVAAGLAVDITSEASVRRMAAAVLDDFPCVDALVNAAGITVTKRAEDLTAEEWRRVVDVNATGTFLCCKVFGEHMIARRAGKIVNLSSVRGRYGSPAGQAEYCASKGAVDALTRSLAAQWAEFGVLVNAVAPTMVETDLTRERLAEPQFAAALRASIPLSRWGTPDDVVGPVLFLVSPASDYITGQILYVDGGLTARI